MYVAYGDPALAGSGVEYYYQHLPNTASITFHVVPYRSKTRGRRYAVEYIMTVQGELPACHPTDPSITLEAQIEELILAYSTNRKTLALYNDDGTATPHILDATDCGGSGSGSTLVDGPWLERRSWPQGDRGEYASHRTYFIEMHCIHDMTEPGDATSQIIEYHESIRYVGNGGPIWRIRYDQSSNAVTMQVVPKTPVHLVQSGWSKGWGGYVLPSAAVQPAYVHNDRVVEIYHSPTIGTCKTKEYVMQWSYPMTIPLYAFTAPSYK
jgi:hypothetical protein